MSRVWPRLNRDQRILFEIIEKSRTIDAAKLYVEYRNLVGERGLRPAEQVTCRKYLQEMTRAGIITALGKGRWRRYQVDE